MMYILFLGLLYKLQGGRFRSFLRALLGYDVEADMTPTTPAAGDGKVAKRKARLVSWSTAMCCEPACMPACVFWDLLLPRCRTSHAREKKSCTFSRHVFPALHR